MHYGILGRSHAHPETVQGSCASMNVCRKCLAIGLLRNYKNGWAAGAAQDVRLRFQSEGNGVVE